MERGNISVSTENIFPIIKKSLYADQEIFLTRTHRQCCRRQSKNPLSVLLGRI